MLTNYKWRDEMRKSHFNDKINATGCKLLKM